MSSFIYSFVIQLMVNSVNIKESLATKGAQEAPSMRNKTSFQTSFWEKKYLSVLLVLV